MQHPVATDIMCRLDFIADTAQLDGINSEKQNPTSLYNLYKNESYITIVWNISYTEQINEIYLQF